MKALLIHHHENNVDAYAPRWAGTYGEAKAIAREVPKHLREEVVVEEFDVQTDKAGIIAALNGEPVYDKKALRTWGITARGALAEEGPAQ